MGSVLFLGGERAELLGEAVFFLGIGAGDHLGAEARGIIGDVAGRTGEGGLIEAEGGDGIGDGGGGLGEAGDALLELGAEFAELGELGHLRLDGLAGGGEIAGELGDGVIPLGDLEGVGLGATEEGFDLRTESDAGARLDGSGGGVDFVFLATRWRGGRGLRGGRGSGGSGSCRLGGDGGRRGGSGGFGVKGETGEGEDGDKGEEVFHERWVMERRECQNEETRSEGSERVFPRNAMGNASAFR